MLQQVLSSAPSAPQHRGVGAAEASGDAQPSGQDFLALLPQAKVQYEVAPAVQTSPEGMIADEGAFRVAAGTLSGIIAAGAPSSGQDEPLQVAGRVGLDASNARQETDNASGEANAALSALPAQPNAASSASPATAPLVAGSLPALPAALAEPGPAGPRSTAHPHAVIPQQETPPIDLSPAGLGLVTIEWSGEPSARSALRAKLPSDDAVGDKPMPAVQDSDLGAGTATEAVLDGAAEPPSALKTEPVSAQPGGSTLGPPLGLFLVEARGLSIPADLGAGTATEAVLDGAAEPPSALKTEPVSAQPGGSTLGPPLGPSLAEARGLSIPADLGASTATEAFLDGAAEPPSVLKTEPVSAQPGGSTLGPPLGPFLAEARGLSIPADPSMTTPGSISGPPGLGLASSPPSVLASVWLPYQRLLHPLLSAQVAPAVLAMGFVPGADGGPGRLTVAVRPAELGTLQITTEKLEEGPARIAVLAERPETLQLLLRDASNLETALRAAGVDDGGGLSLTFGLANQGSRHGARDAPRNAGHADGPSDGADAKPATVGVAYAMAPASLLDLSL